MFEPGQNLQNRSRLNQPGNEIGIFDGAHAVADPRRLDEIERIGNAFRAADLTRMDGQPKARIAGNIEGAGVVCNPAHALFAGHVEAGHQRMPGAGRIFRRRDHPFRTEMPLAGYDDAGFDAGFFFRNPDAFGDTGKIGVCAEPDAVTMVWRDDNFAIDGVGLRKLGQIGFRQDRIILIRLEHLRHRVITLDEFGKIRPDILAVTQEAAGVYAVFLRLFSNEGRGCRAFDVAVNFRFQQM